MESFRDFQQKLQFFSLAHPFHSLNGFFLIFEEDNKIKN
jgi:hypothetical protein